MDDSQEPGASAPIIEAAPAEQELWGGRIEVRGEVGRGAMGQVLLGFDTKLRREMALKVTHLPRGEIPRQLLARFVEEAQVNAQLEHPNIAPVHDLGLDPQGRAYFSMKLVRGRSLEDILEARLNGDEATLAEFGLRRLLDVFLQVCLAMEYAHARGVIHRDLKPGNVMIGDFGEVAVMDWGVAKLREISAGVSTEVDALTEADLYDQPVSAPAPVTSVRAEMKAWQTHHGAVLGTPHYMAPEQAKGAAVDERSDLYSLGVMLYEILCGQVPFDHEDPTVVVRRVILENPRPPSTISANVPPALETLAMRLLAKEPEERTLTLPAVRAHLQDYIDGISRDYRPQALWASVAWSGGALVLFAFLVWYLTGQSIATVVAVGPPAVLNAVGWFLFVLAIGYPLWAASTALRVSRRPIDPFREPTSQELFVSGYLAHRTFAAALAPLFQLVFIVELVMLAVIAVTREAGRSREIVTQLTAQMRAEWSEALIVVLVFQFAYLVLLASEARFARRIDRSELLVRRPPWESVWPVFLLGVLLASVITTDVLGVALGTKHGTVTTLFWRELLQVPERPFEIIKTLVFQGTFLLGLSVTTLVAAFPVTELLAASRAVFHAADEASVATRAKYFLRSIAAMRVARAVWLYGGAMIGTLTAMRILSEEQAHPLVEKLLYILGPSLIGFAGYSALRRSLNGFMERAPAVMHLVKERTEAALPEQRKANLEVLEHVPWRLPFGQIAVPLVCVTAYLLWTGSGLKRAGLHQLIPVTTKDWLVVLPYVLLVPMLLGRDYAQKWLLRRGDQRSTVA